MSRRGFLQIGALAGMSLAELLGAKATGAALPAPKAKNAILIWLDGGPSHLETFDLKPLAPREVRGPLAPISTTVPGIQICELLPRTAALMNRLAIVRSVTSPLGEHNFGAHYLLTGYKPTPVLEHPAIGSVVAHLRPHSGELPSHIAIPEFRVGGGRLAGNGFLPAAARPFSLMGDPSQADFRVRHLEYYPEVDSRRSRRRMEHLAALDRFSEGKEPSAPGAPANPFLEQAHRLTSSQQARQAFNLNEEPASVREKYGPRTIGQSCLLARRLVERGVPFVTVNDPGWDTHQNLYTRLKEGYTGARQPVGLVPSLDLAVSGLIGDLEERGLLGETLVMVMGEFGRTPKLNVDGGRDHWPRVFSVAFAGGGVPGGQVIGASDRAGEGPADRPVTPADLANTIFRLLGIDPDTLLSTADGRPIQVNRDGKPIGELLG